MLNQKKYAFSSALILTVLISHQVAYGAQEFDYPELSVTPRASDRLDMEVARAEQQSWQTHLNLQVPAAMTLVNGLWFMMNASDRKDYVATDLNPANASNYWAGIAVGGAWLAATVAMNAYYHPYVAAQKEVSAMAKKTQREQLTRERMAEEAIRSAGNLAKKLKWFSVLTNLGANGYLAYTATNGSMGQIISGLAAVTSLTPLIFNHPWEHVSNVQGDYKKRIYAPVASAGFIPDYAHQSAAPGMSLSLFF